MALSVNAASWASGAIFFEPILILPFFSKTLTYSNTLVCHTLYKLIYKIQEYAFKYFFPEMPGPFSEPSFIIPSKFELLNSCLATGISLSILNQIRRPALAKVLINYRLYAMGLPFVNFALLISCLIIYRVASQIYKNLYPIQKTQMTITEENRVKAEEIKSLIEKIQILIEQNTIYFLENNENYWIDNVSENDSYLIDKVSLSFPSLPIREKGNPQHLWDVIETIDPLMSLAMNEGADPKCPNGCRKKLELEDAVDTDVQDEIINLLRREIEFLESLEKVCF